MYRINLWDKDVPHFNEEFTNEHNANCPSLDCYICEGEETRPAVLIIPGGGYDHRADHEGGTIANEFVGNGYNAFVLNYRVAPYKHPVMLNDAQRAMRYIRYNSQKLRTDPYKIAALGFSAGGNLAGLLAEYYDKYDYEHRDEQDTVSAKPDALILCYAVSSNYDAYRHVKSAENLAGDDEELKRDLSLNLNIRDDMGPVFMWHTFEDGSVNCINSLRLATALKEHEIPVELHLFPHGRHGLGLATGMYGTDQWFYLMLRWLKGIGFGI